MGKESGLVQRIFLHADILDFGGLFSLEAETVLGSFIVILLFLLENKTEQSWLLREQSRHLFRCTLSSRLELEAEAQIGAVCLSLLICPLISIMALNSEFIELVVLMFKAMFG